MVVPGDDGDELVEQRDGVAFQDLAVAVGVLGQQGQFGAALAEAQVERQQGHDHVQPGRETLHHG